MQCTFFLRMQRWLMVLLLGALAGCGGPGATSPTAEIRAERRTSSPQRLEEVARRFGQALVAEDYHAAYALLSARLRQQVSSMRFDEAARQARREYGRPLALTRVDLNTSDALEGERASVSYGFSQAIPDRDRLAWAHATLAVEMDGDEVLNCYNCWMLLENDHGQEKIGHFEFRRCD